MTGDLAAFNVCGDDIFGVVSYQGMVRLTKDGSVFETVLEDGKAPISEPTTETEN